jgi:proteic killer suppression protein
MIKSFADKQTEAIFHGSVIKKLDMTLIKKAKLRLEYLNAAVQLEDLYFPPSNKFHALQGYQTTRYAIRVNEKCRITFAWQNNHAFNVCFEDYH